MIINCIQYFIYTIVYINIIIRFFYFNKDFEILPD